MSQSYRLSLLLALFTLIVGTHIKAQELVLEDFRLDSSDLTARLQPHQDRNGDECALILISTGLANVNVQGDLGGAEAEYKLGSLFVWVPKGARSLTFTHSQFPRLEFSFPLEIKALNVYKATLKAVYPSGEARLIVNVIPAEAYVEINGEPVKNDNGMVNIPAKNGSYSYTIRASGYETATGQWTCDGNSVESQFVSLKPLHSTLEISTYPESGMKLYIQDKYVGKTPWPNSDEEREKAQLTPGLYRIRVEKETVLPFDTSILINDMGKTYKEKLYARPRWKGAYKHNYKPLTILIGIGGTTDFFSGLDGHLDITLRHWLHKKPLPDKTRFAMDYQLIFYHYFDIHRGKYLGYDIYSKGVYFTKMDALSVQIGPSFTLTPTYRGYGQFAVYGHIGYHIGWGNGFLKKYYDPSNDPQSVSGQDGGFTSTVGVSFAIKNVGFAGEYTFRHHKASLDDGGNISGCGEHGVGARIFVKIGK